MGNVFSSLVSPFRRPRSRDDATRWPSVVVFSAGLCIATAALIWLGYVATREWRRGTDLLLEGRAAEALALVAAALNTDMKGAWATLLVPLDHRTIGEEPPYDLLHPTARTFARFPYPESLIVWKDRGTGDGPTYVFSRADRRPHWDRQQPSDDPFPVVLQKNPPAMRAVVRALRDEASAGRPFVLLETTIDGVPYQIVAHLLFSSERPYPLAGLGALAINMQWVREEYFAPLLTQVARIGGTEAALSLAILDDERRLVAAAGSPPDATRDVERRFPMMFLDSTLVASVPARKAAAREWVVRVRPSGDNTTLAALSGARRTFVMMAIAAGVSVLALLLTVRADRASAALASMKSDFVSAVTHELKTPVALIQLVGDTLAQKRYTSTETIQDYARLLSNEATRLGHSIDSLLTYARYSDTRRQSLIELTQAELHDLVEDALEQFRPKLARLGFEVTVDVPQELPPLKVDRHAMVLVMESVIDNAIKYSEGTRALRIAGQANGKYVKVTFADRGIGIAEEDQARVFERFYRGRNAKQGGSGLGLSIARRIVNYHGGTIALRSTEHVGTEVMLHLPIASGS